MSATRSAVGALGVTALVAMSVLPADVAAATTPPPVDDAALPPAAPAAPPRRTMRFDDCVSAPTEPAAPADAGQLIDLDLPTVWALTRGAGQTVAVIDTGVARHRLLPHLVSGGDFVATGDGTADCDGHGTIVAGIIGAQPTQAGAFSGIAPDVTILAIRQSSNMFRAVDDPAGSGFGDVGTLAAAVRTAADLGATVINISSVACVAAEGGIDDRALGAALSYAVDTRNAVVVTAAGNTAGPGQCPGTNPGGSDDSADVAVIASPAWYDEFVLTVGSAAPDGSASSFTLPGPWVDVAAPGEAIVSLAAAGDGLVPEPGSAPLSGTSYATPVVSAIAALVRARFPELTARQVMQRIEDTAHRPAAGWNAAVGHGVVDALAAVSGGSPMQPGPSSTPVDVAVARAAPDRGSQSVGVRASLSCLAFCAVAAVVAAGRLRSRRDAVPDH